MIRGIGRSKFKRLQWTSEHFAQVEARMYTDHVEDIARAIGRAPTSVAHVIRYRFHAKPIIGKRQKPGPLSPERRRAFFALVDYVGGITAADYERCKG